MTKFLLSDILFFVFLVHEIKLESKKMCFEGWNRICICMALNEHVREEIMKKDNTDVSKRTEDIEKGHVSCLGDVK